ncbi:hypothetical protein RJ641_008017 [Dillenia turbinata]|uniref:Uncharacterized protein n=1 Tax=Dillenia turbinata TaxID=194707 RepID=A0AAN8ZAD5_9MAGN
MKGSDINFNGIIILHKLCPSEFSGESSEGGDLIRGGLTSIPSAISTNKFGISNSVSSSMNSSFWSLISNVNGLIIVFSSSSLIGSVSGFADLSSSGGLSVPRLSLRGWRAAAALAAAARMSAADSVAGTG